MDDNSISNLEELSPQDDLGLMQELVDDNSISNLEELSPQDDLGLMQDKAANLFRPAYRSAVKGSRTEQDPPLGLFGGEKAVRSKLSEASKEDDLLAKTIDKPSRSRKSYKGKQTKFRRSNRRSRSRSRSRRSRSRSRGSPHRTRSKKQKVSSSKA